VIAGFAKNLAEQANKEVALLFHPDFFRVCHD
jgi:hypothetical protein